jgi:hypothetical protein
MKTIARVRRAEQVAARSDTRGWVVQRRERTRQLIELGALVMKAGLVELTGDNRAALLGGFITMAATLNSEDAAQTLALWRRAGARAFAPDQREGVG